MNPYISNTKDDWRYPVVFLALRSVMGRCGSGKVARRQAFGAVPFANLLHAGEFVKNRLNNLARQRFARHSLLSTFMVDPKLKESIRAAYVAKYGDVAEFKVAKVIPDVYGVTVAVVNGHLKSGELLDEVCFVRNKVVRIFSTTEELATELGKGAAAAQAIDRLEEERQSMKRRARYAFSELTAGRGLIGLGTAFLSLVVWMHWPWGCYVISLIVVIFGAYMWMHGQGERRMFDARERELGFEIDLQRMNVPSSEARAEKLLRINDSQLQQYYQLNLRQNSGVFVLGVLCIFLGAASIAGAMYYLKGVAGKDTTEKILTGVLGAVGAILTNFVAVIYLKMHAEAAGSMVKLHGRLAQMHQILFGNLVASRIDDDSRRWDTQSKLALLHFADEERATKIAEKV